MYLTSIGINNPIYINDSLCAIKCSGLEQMQVTTNKQINPLILGDQQIHQTKNC